MPLQFNTATQIGTIETDYLFGLNDGPNHTLNGKGGNDFLIGDYGLFWMDPDHAVNNSILNATNIDDASLWYTVPNPLVFDSGATPYTTIHLTGEGSAEYFAITVGAGDVITVDVDFAEFDTTVEIFGPSETVVASNDNGSHGSDDPLNNAGESYLSFTALAAGTHYIRIADLNGANIPTSLLGGDIATGLETLVHVSVTNHASTGTISDFSVGDDSLNGSDGDDQLFGMGGDDVLIGGDGNDYMDGGDGTDRADYTFISTGVTVDLSITGQQDTIGAGLDTLVNLEGVYGSNMGDDILTAADSGSFLVGWIGNDTLNGGIGDDTLDGREGLDIISGGAGDDRVDTRVGEVEAGEIYDGGEGMDRLIIWGTGGGGTIDFRDVTLQNLELIVLASNIASDVTVQFNATHLTLNTFEDVDSSARTAAVNLEFHADGLTSDIDLSGLVFDSNWDDARDTILVQGDGVANDLTGTFRDDTINGDAGDDLIIGGDGDDALDGGLGEDTASYSSAAAAVSVDLSIAGQQDTINAGMDTLSNIENLTGSAFADTLTGDNGDNVIEGGLGDDMLDGGSGSDTASYAGATSGVTVDLNLDGVQQDTGGGGLDTLSDFENIIGSSKADTLTGDAGDNTFAPGFKADIVDGGAGIDTVDYSLSDFFQTISLASNVNINGHANGDILTSIENVLGSNSRKDDITGNLGDNVLDGQGGNDILRGGRGDDTLLGGDGKDALYGGKGADVHDGGDGRDWVKYNGSSEFVEIDLINGGTAGIALGDTYSNVENVRGTDFDDTILANDDDNKIIAGKGNDIVDGRGGDDALQGNDGNDTIAGGAGKDTMRGQAGDDVFVFNAGDGIDKVLDFDDNGDDQIDLSSFGFASFADVQAIMFQVGSRVNIDFGSGDVLRLENTNLADMGADDFILSGGAAEFPDSKAANDDLPSLSQDLIAAFMADSTIQSPIYQTRADGILEIMTDDDFAQDWDLIGIV